MRKQRKKLIIYYFLKDKKSFKLNKKMKIKIIVKLFIYYFIKNKLKASFLKVLP